MTQKEQRPLQRNTADRRSHPVGRGRWSHLKMPKAKTARWES